MRLLKLLQRPPRALWRLLLSRSGWQAAGITAVGLALVGLSARSDDMRTTHGAMTFAINQQRLARFTADVRADTATLRSSYLIDSAGALLYSFGAAALLYALWPRGWPSERQQGKPIHLAVTGVALLAGVFDLLENAIVLMFAGAEPISMPARALRLTAAAGLAKWSLVAATVLALFLTLYGCWRFRGLDSRIYLEESDRPEESEPARQSERSEQSDVHKDKNSEVSGAAICLSGGGIRSAAFCWGALAKLQADGLFRHLGHIYSVSGGGYAAAAWSGAMRGDSNGDLAVDRTERHLTQFFRVEAPAGMAPDSALGHVRRHRHYLKTTGGGLNRSILKALGGMALNLTIIVCGILVLAIPVGLVARSHLSPVQMPDSGTHGLLTRLTGAWPHLLSLQMPGSGTHGLLTRLTGASSHLLSVRTSEAGPEVVPGTYRVLLIVLTPAVVLWFLRATLRAGSRHSRPLALGAAAWLGVAIVTATIFVALPWGAGQVRDSDSLQRFWAAIPAALVWAGGVALAVVRPRLAKVAVRLGGIALAAAMLLLALWTISRFQLPQPSSPKYVAILDEHAWIAWVVWLAVIVVLVLIDLMGVQWWSLHPVYRDSLAGAFAIVRPAPDGSVLTTQGKGRWPTWQRIRDADAAAPDTPPRHTICAATHRRTADATGVRATAFTFSPDGVRLHWPTIRPDGTVEVRTVHRTAGWLDTAVGAGSSGTERSSVLAAAAMSGAAFNSAMGRHSMGSTDSLLAALNLRLGVWLPNPRYDELPLRRAGLRYLFHEVIGFFDLTDPFIHVSDGGHYENLGLVEALRARTRTIVVVDASGGRIAPVTDGPAGAGFGALFEAIDLARIELQTQVAIDVTPLRPDPRTGRAGQSWTRGTVTYHTDAVHDWLTCGCQQADLIYVKAVVSNKTPEAVLAYANADRVFPDYPTGNQFLSEKQFDALVRLGEHAMSAAIAGGGGRALLIASRMPKSGTVKFSV